MNFKEGINQGGIHIIYFSAISKMRCGTIMLLVV